jgi:nitrite reductase/ring-hydroxylating ferredoxin subunit
MTSSAQPRLAVAAFGSELIESGATASPGQRQKSETKRTSMQYTTQTILPSLTWTKAGVKGKDLQNGDLQAVCISGLDICVGKTDSGQIFAVGDKAPPTGLSFSMGGEVQGDKLVEAQYGNVFDVKTGEPIGDWCPSPPVIGPLIGAFMGDKQAVAVFDVRQDFFSGEIEVLCDSNAKKAYEADYWKGVLDAQGKNDGTYY